MEKDVEKEQTAAAPPHCADAAPTVSTDPNHFLELAPHCHLHYDSASNNYRMDVFLKLSDQMKLAEVQPAPVCENTTEHVCTAGTEEHQCRIIISVVNDQTATGELVYLQYNNIFDAKHETCSRKVFVKVETQGGPKGKVYIRTIDADDFGG